MTCKLLFLLIFSECKKLDKTSKTICTINQTFGIKFNINYDDVSINQTDINNKLISNGVFLKKDIKTNLKKNFTFFEFKKKYKDKSDNVQIIFNKGKLEIIHKKNKTTTKRETNNIYFLLDEVLKLDLKANGYPDYFKEENEIVFVDKSSNTLDLYKLYFAYMKKYRVYNNYTYINEQVNLTLGEVLSTYGNPALVLHSGNGDVVLVYLGAHLCKKNLYYGILIFVFDIQSICRTIFYNIERCKNCHKENNGDYFKLDNGVFKNR